MPTARVFLFALVLGLIGCGKDKDNPAPAVPEPATAPQAAAASQPSVPAPADKQIVPDTPTPPKETPPSSPAAGWTDDPKAMAFPAGPAAGKVGGQPFAPQSVDVSRIRGRFLTLRQGEEANPDVEVKVLLSATKEESFAGKTYEILPDNGPGAPPISLARKGASPMPAEPTLFTEKYAMRLEFGQESDGKLPGRIYLCLPDEAKSYVAGTFTAEVEPEFAKPPRPDEAPCVVGRIARKGRESMEVVTGFIGLTSAGSPISNLTGTTVMTGTETSVASATYPPQRSALVNDAEAGCLCRHSRLPPGRYLVFVGTGELYIDWRWVEVRDGAVMTLDFSLEPEVAGSLAVLLPKGVKDGVRLIPLDEAGKMPDVKEALSLVSLALPVKGEPKDGKLQLDGLRPGRYRVSVAGVEKDVTVKARETAETDLSAP
jgi:hypothetical protein